MRTARLALFPALFMIPAVLLAEDWPQWRGPRRDGISTEKGLLKSWPSDGPKLLWDSKKIADGKSVGTGVSSLAVVGDRVYTLGDFLDPASAAEAKEKPKDKKAERKGDSYVFCLDAKSGKELWKTKVGPYFYNSFGSGARSTPTIDGGKLYAITPHGVIVCLDAQSGKLLWEKSLTKEFGGKMMSGWGFSESPTIDGDKVLCTPGGKKAAVVALNKDTGATIWTCEIPKESGAGYASIVSTTVGGVKQYITLLSKDPGLIGVDAKTGKFLWSYNKAANGTANIPTPVVKDDHVFTSTSYGAGAGVVKLVPDDKGGINAEEVWFLPGTKLNNHHGGVVMIGDYIYGGHGQNDGRPFCLEWKTGKLVWGPERGPGSGSAAVLYADGNLYFRYQNGVVALVEASPEKLNVVSTFEAHLAQNDWPHLVIADGKLYLRGEDTIHCYDLRK